MRLETGSVWSTQASTHRLKAEQIACLALVLSMLISRVRADASGSMQQAIPLTSCSWSEEAGLIADIPKGIARSPENIAQFTFLDSAGHAMAREFVFGDLRAGADAIGAATLVPAWAVKGYSKLICSLIDVHDPRSISLDPGTCSTDALLVDIGITAELRQVAVFQGHVYLQLTFSELTGQRMIGESRLDGVSAFVSADGRGPSAEVPLYGWEPSTIVLGLSDLSRGRHDIAYGPGTYLRSSKTVVGDVCVDT